MSYPQSTSDRTIRAALRVTDLPFVRRVNRRLRFWAPPPALCRGAAWNVGVAYAQAFAAFSQADKGPSTLALIIDDMAAAGTPTQADSGYAAGFLSTLDAMLTGKPFIRAPRLSDNPLT